MNRRFISGTFAAMLFAGSIALALPHQVYSMTVPTATVKVKSGFVRSAASGQSSVSFCVANGDEVAILGEEKGKDGTWYRICIGTSTGYIRSDLVTKTNNKINVSDSLAKNTAAATTSSAPSTAAAVAAANTAASAASAPSTNGTIKGTSVRMRSNASQTSGVVTVLNTGDGVNILAEGKAGDGQIWYQVRANDKSGFIRSDLVTKNSNDPAAPVSANGQTTQQTTQPTAAADSSGVVKTIEPGTGLVKGVNVRIRGGASTTSDIVGTVSSGAELKLMGVEKAPDREWIKIETTVDGNAVSGYIARDYVTVTKEVKEIIQTTQTIIGSDTGPANTTAAEAPAAVSPLASIKGVGVRIRVAPVDGNVVCQLSSGHPVNIKKETNGSDGYTWYQVSFSYLGSDREGFVRSDLVTKPESEAEAAPIGSEEFEESIASLPETYKNSLRAIHEKHPKWKFETVDTGLEWKDALTAESAVAKNLVSKNAIASWKSTAPQAYNQASNQWYTFDGGSWASASPELIAYYMDPRNFLNESGIYMFEKLDYSDTQTENSVAKMLTGTFMSGSASDSDGSTFNYSELFRKVGEQTGVSPYLLAGRALQEQGIGGNSQSISGRVPGYENYFNYFNIGAYAYSGRSATINGLIYATGSDEDYARPWNTRARSIYGGARYLAEKYVLKGQNTLYFQKFNVVNRENTLYSHQYMSNIQAASSESSRLQLAYLGDDEVLTFRIPFYRNMPEMRCQKPTSDSNPNTYLASLSVNAGELKPAFSGVTDNYIVNVGSDCETVEISASAVCPTSSVGGTGTFTLKPGANTFYVSCKAQNGSSKTYMITVNR